MSTSTWEHAKKQQAIMRRQLHNQSSRFTNMCTNLVAEHVSITRSDV